VNLSRANVKEHATLSAGASVDHGVEVEDTEDHVNRAADRGCCVSTCSASLIFVIRENSKTNVDLVAKEVIDHAQSMGIVGRIAIKHNAPGMFVAKAVASLMSPVRTVDVEPGHVSVHARTHAYHVIDVGHNAQIREVWSIGNTVPDAESAEGRVGVERHDVGGGAGAAEGLCGGGDCGAG